MRQKTYVLAKAILERRDLLFNTNENVIKPHALKEKEDAWEAVRNEMIEQGFMNFERKSWRDVRNHDWQYLRRSAMAKYEHNQKGGVEPIQYSEVDRVVFEIMGNEVGSTSSHQFDSLNGTPYNSNIWLRNDEQQNEVIGAESPSFFPFSQTATTMETGTSSKTHQPSYSNEQQQFNSLLNKAIAAGTTALNRKVSWDTASPAGSPEDDKHFLHSTPINEKNDFVSNSGTLSQVDLLQSIMTSSQLVHTHQNRPSQTPKQNDVNVAQSSSSQGVLSSSSSRKRHHSPSSDGTKSVDEELSEAKLRLFLMQTKREELILQQERCKLAQEEAKARQEKAKAEILELQLRAERARAGFTLD